MANYTIKKNLSILQQQQHFTKALMLVKFSYQRKAKKKAACAFNIKKTKLIAFTLLLSPKTTAKQKIFTGLGITN